MARTEGNSGPAMVVGVNDRFSRRPRRRRSGGRWLISFLLLLALLWCGYWFAAYTLTSSVVGTPQAAATRFNSTVTCSDRAFGGFPLSVALDCTTLTASAPGLDASIAGVSADAALYNPGHVAATAAGPLRVNAPAYGLGIDAAWERGEASLRADLSGLARASSTADGLRVILTGPAAPVAGFSVGHWQGSLEQADGDAAGLRLVFDAADLQVADGAGALLPAVSSDGRVTLLGAGPITSADFGGMLAAWSAGGGAMEVERLAFATGEVGFAVAGPLTLSPEGLLSGALTIRIFGTDQLAELIAGVFPRFRDDAANIAGALVALTTTVQTPAGPAQETRLTLRNGAVSVGLVKIFDIPPVAIGG